MPVVDTGPPSSSGLLSTGNPEAHGDLEGLMTPTFNMFLSQLL